MFRWLVTVDAVDKDNNPKTLRFSDGKFIRDGKVYLPRLSQPALYRFGMYAGSILSTEASGFGEATLINNDGRLEYLADYAIDGRSVTIERVNNNKKISEVFSGTALGFRFSGNEVVIRLRDPREPLNDPHPHEKYKGDNVLPDGREGVEEDLKGVVKPQVFGIVVNANPPMVNTSRLIFEVSSRQDCKVLNVYDNGVKLYHSGEVDSVEELENNEPEPSSFISFQGYFKVGSSPSGTVTCDAQTNKTKAGDVLRQICEDVGLSLSDCSVSSLNTVGDVGYYLDSSETTTALMDQLCESVGAFISMQNEGEVFAELLSPPEDHEPIYEINEYMVSDATRSAVGSGDNGLPIWRVEFGADRIAHTQSEVAGVVDDSVASRLSKEYRTASAESQSTKGRHPLSKEYKFDSWLRSISDAESVCSRLLDLYSVRRDRLTMELQVSSRHDTKVGDVVKVNYPRFGYFSPRKMLVLGVELDASDKIQTLDLWG